MPNDLMESWEDDSMEDVTALHAAGEDFDLAEATQFADDLEPDVYDPTTRDGLFDGDQGDLPAEARYALTRLIRDRYVSDEDGAGRYRKSAYSLILEYKDDITRNLNNLCLVLNVNEKYKVAWASTAPFDGSMPGVVLKRSLVQKRDITLLLITLRIAAQNAELEGRNHWYIDKHDMVGTFTTLSPYADEGNAALVQRRIDAAIAEACTCGYIQESQTTSGRYRILPIVAAIMTLERAQQLIAQLQDQMDQEGGEEDGQ
ncbi:MAG: DUF4194 domain-containing protein [Atopobiaceae bacterium]|nr:DUF4194 domain-containing protein [Atopobiaceae bacterium]